MKLSHPLSGHPLSAHLPARYPARRAGLEGTAGNPRWVLEGIQGLVKVPAKLGPFLNVRAYSSPAEFHRVVPGMRKAPLPCPVFENLGALSKEADSSLESALILLWFPAAAALLSPRVDG